MHNCLNKLSILNIYTSDTQNCEITEEAGFISMIRFNASSLLCSGLCLTSTNQQVLLYQSKCNGKWLLYNIVLWCYKPLNGDILLCLTHENKYPSKPPLRFNNNSIAGARKISNNIKMNNCCMIKLNNVFIFKIIIN